MIRLGAWGAVGVIAVLGIGCGSDVVVIEGGGGSGDVVPPTSGNGGGGTDGSGGDAPSSGGGGAASVPRSIEVDIETYGLPPSNDWLVLINRATGELQQTLTIDDLPAQVEVVDGDTVSFYRREEPYGHLQSYRVTPDVTRVAELDSIPGTIAPCHSEPMQVTVVFPELDGAVDYFAETDNYGHAYSQTSGEKVMQVESCGDTFDVLAYARGGSDIIGHELLQDLPYSPGGAMTIQLTLTNDARSESLLEIEDVDGLAFVSVFADWRRHPSMYPYESGTHSVVSNPTGTQLFDIAPIEPAPSYGEVFTHVASALPSDSDEICDGQTYNRIGPSGGPVHYVPRRLASVRPTADNSWVFATDGEPGDFVWNAWRFGEVAGWVIWEDARRPPLPAVFPELPADVPWPSNESPTPYSTGQQDHYDRESYAMLLADPVDATGPSEVAWRVWWPCDE